MGKLDSRIVVIKVNDGEDYGIRFTDEQMKAQKERVTITDVTCCDCKGAVTAFLIPDKVWLALGLSKEWICLFCLARRLNPHLTANELNLTPDEFSSVVASVIDEEISRQKRKFRLKAINRYGGEKVSSMQVVQVSSFAGSSTATADQVMGRRASLN